MIEREKGKAKEKAANLEAEVKQSQSRLAQTEGQIRQGWEEGLTGPPAIG
ncbi:hypothetical protein LCGC14_2414560 [marine sediment metagenome]|uniref:Uncharacterized protein n=1 Tax=marine sediment metagenome TaxID=412755 RepID=A0A0F9CDP1_9ZZZZ